MISIISRQPRAISIAVGILYTISLWIFLPHFKQSFSNFSTTSIPSLVPNHHDKLIANGTLGFEKIFVLGLSDRSDRRDSMEMAADVTNLRFEWVDGVLPTAMNPKTIPPTYKLPAVLPGVVGCWRSHMNIIRRIVKEKITSALIFEDDADWDLRIVEQMHAFSVGTKEMLATGNQESSRHPRTQSPYGEGWDVLWIGHCGGFHANTHTVPHYIIKDDPTMPPMMSMAVGDSDMLFGVTPYDNWGPHNNNTPCAAHPGRDPQGKVCDQPRLGVSDRIIQERAKPVCTAAYAISYQGARKMLARVGGLSLTDVFAPVDQGFGDVCSGATDLPGERTRCFTPSPPYVRGYKPKGMEVGDSDIRVTGTHGERRPVGWSRGIMQSVRLNANSIVSGLDLKPEEQYVRDGFIRDEREGKGDWRLTRANEYRSFKNEVVVDHWIW